MQVFKFGGASVKDAEGVRNVAKVLQEVGYQETLVVVSAMGKTTNKLELVVKAYFEEKSMLQEYIQDIITCHEEILFDLFPNKQHSIYKTVTV